jgi:integrase
LINEAALRREYVNRNVAERARIPQHVAEGRERIALTRQQRSALYDTLTGDRLGPYFTVLAELGLRPGEADALNWDDVDLESRSIFVRYAMKRDEAGKALSVGPTKTLRSSRPLRLTDRCVDAFQIQRGIQAEERLRAGSAWSVDDRWLGLVFVSEAGTPHNPSNLRRSLAAMCNRADIPKVSPYELRHSVATILRS